MPESPPIPVVSLDPADPAAAVGTVVEIGPAGMEFQLHLDPGQEIGQIRLALSAGDGDETLDAAIATDLGPRGAAWPSEEIAWIIADWGEERPLHAVHVKKGPTGAAQRAQLKTATGDSWVPLYPVDSVAVDAEQRFPAVLTSRVMIEMKAPNPSVPAILEPSTMAVTGLTVKATGQPHDLTVELPGGTVVFEHQGTLPAGRELTVDGLTGAINTYLQSRDGQRPVSLIARARVAGKATIAAFEVETLRVVDRLSRGDGDDGTAILHIPWQAEVRGQVSIASGATVMAVELAVTAELARERLYLVPDSVDRKLAHLCDARHSAAQGFAALPEGTALAGFDLYLRPGAEPVAGLVQLYPDHHGRPADGPYQGADIALTMPASEPGKPAEPGWVSAQLDRPTALTETFWIVVHITAGAAAWHTSAHIHHRVTRSLYRVGGGPWLERRTPASNPDHRAPVWALTRLRVADPAPTPITAHIRRGSEQVRADMDADGRISLTTAEALIPLNAASAKSAADLELVIQADSAGTASIRDLRVRYAEVSS